MDKLLYIAMSGAKQTMLAQNTHSNNLANVDTNGFKADLAQARSMPVFGEHFPSRVYSMTERPGVNYTEGNHISTGRELDVTVLAEGWLTVQDDAGGEAFTRAGNLRVDEVGFVRTQSGQIVMGNAGPLILPEFEKLEIGVDGVVSVRGLGQGPEGLVEVDQLKLVNPPLDQIEKGLDGLFRRTDGVIEPPDFNVRVMTGMLEGSNVNAVHSMIGIVNLQRQFELQVKLMDKAETMDQATSQLLKMN